MGAYAGTGAGSSVKATGMIDGKAYTDAYPNRTKRSFFIFWREAAMLPGGRSAVTNIPAMVH